MKQRITNSIVNLNTGEEENSMEERLNAILEPYKGKRDALIPVLQKVQEEIGYLPDQAMLEIAKTTGVPESQVYGVASFYAQFRFTPRGKHTIMVCRGTACHVRGAERILEETERALGIAEGETTEDQQYTLETVACIGCCALAPCVMIDEDVEAKLTPQMVPKILNGRDEK
jgi:NADH-quinone oxidoreductase subunit E